MKLCIIVKYNQYETKVHFAEAFSKALEGVGCSLLLTDGETWFRDAQRILKEFQPDAILSFNRSQPLPDGTYWWKNYPIPFVALLVDSLYYYEDLLKASNTLITCVDRYDVHRVGTQGFNQPLFLPHAVEKNLFDIPFHDKRYDVVMIGSCYEPESVRQFWKETLPKHLSQIVEEAVARLMEAPKIHFFDATKQSAERKGVSVEEMIKHKLPVYADYYIRGIDRIRLIQSIHTTPVHVFGGSFAIVGNTGKGWAHYLRSQKNVTLHSALSYQETMDVVAKARICLNSTPSFMEGAHERIFMALASNCMIMTSRNRFLEEEFGNNIALYDSFAMEHVEDKIKALLDNEEATKKSLQSAKQRVKEYHTWDQRAQTLINRLQIVGQNQLFK